MSGPESAEPRVRPAFEEVLAQWQAAQAELNKWTRVERELRLSLFTAAVPTPKIGVNNVELGDGRVCKFTHKLSYRVDAWDDMGAAITAAGGDPATIIVPRNTFRDSAYRKAPEAVRRAAEPFITTRAGLPSLEIK